MEVAEVIAVLDRLAAVGLDFWVDGGWGVDALVGEQTRPHGDLDIVVGAEGLGRAADALAALDYAHDAAARPGLPARLVLHAGARRQVDLHPVVLDRHGNGWQPLGDDVFGAYPADGLAAMGSIGGRRVRCLTADLQPRHHLGYPPDEADRHDVRLLARHFGVPLPPGW